MSPEIRDMPERATAMRRQVVHPHDIGMTIGRGASELRADLAAAGADVLGPSYARYHSWTKDEADVEVGFEVTTPIVADGFEISTLSAGREAVATHRGAYKDIPKTFAALEAWVGDHATGRGVPREVYLSNPDEVPMDERITEIVFPIV
ncbi:MAG: GyrI-like domain-containing protein [Acidimicrobiia bacterium]|nr:GyrI-like domain-containing protein [Acidimicrobiia bacterium]